jgi:hypothetical protein
MFNAERLETRSRHAPRLGVVRECAFLGRFTAQEWRLSPRATWDSVNPEQGRKNGILQNCRRIKDVQFRHRVPDRPAAGGNPPVCQMKTSSRIALVDIITQTPAS